MARSSMTIGRRPFLQALRNPLFQDRAETNEGNGGEQLTVVIEGLFLLRYRLERRVEDGAGTKGSLWAHPQLCDGSNCWSCQ